jgi:hypothetical protein
MPLALNHLVVGNRREVMKNRLRELWYEMKKRGEIIGVVLIIVGFVGLLAQFALVLRGLRTESGLLGASLGLLSVGLGFVAIGMSAKLEEDVARLPTLFKNDTLTIAGQQLAEYVLTKEGKRRRKDIATRFRLSTEEQSREEAQKRLDEDTKRVGYVRGELYRREDGSWGIAWGGKYPL